MSDVVPSMRLTGLARFPGRLSRSIETLVHGAVADLEVTIDPPELGGYGWGFRTPVGACCPLDFGFDTYSHQLATIGYKLIDERIALHRDLTARRETAGTPLFETGPWSDDWYGQTERTNYHAWTRGPGFMVFWDAGLQHVEQLLVVGPQLHLAFDAADVLQAVIFPALTAAETAVLVNTTSGPGP